MILSKIGCVIDLKIVPATFMTLGNLLLIWKRTGGKFYSINIYFQNFHDGVRLYFVYLRYLRSAGY